MNRLSLRVIYYLIIVCGILGCQNRTEVASNEINLEENSDQTSINERAIDSMKYTEYALSKSAENATRNWAAFQELTTHMML